VSFSFIKLHQHRADSATNALAAPMPIIGSKHDKTFILIQPKNER